MFICPLSSPSLQLPRAVTLDWRVDRLLASSDAEGLEVPSVTLHMTTSHTLDRPQPHASDVPASALAQGSASSAGSGGDGAGAGVVAEANRADRDKGDARVRRWWCWWRRNGNHCGWVDGCGHCRRPVGSEVQSSLCPGVEFVQFVGFPSVVGAAAPEAVDGCSQGHGCVPCRGCDPGGVCATRGGPRSSGSRAGGSGSDCIWSDRLGRPPLRV